MRIALLASADVAWATQLARSWVAQGDAVTLVLLDGAAGASRAGHVDSGEVAEALRAGAAVWAHDEALARRGIGPARLADGIKVTDLDAVADLVADGADRVVWL